MTPPIPLAASAANASWVAGPASCTMRSCASRVLSGRLCTHSTDRQAPTGLLGLALVGTGAAEEAVTGTVAVEAVVAELGAAPAPMATWVAPVPVSAVGWPGEHAAEAVTVTAISETTQLLRVMPADDRNPISCLSMTRPRRLGGGPMPPVRGS